MGVREKRAIVTYYGLDGACSAAVALNRYPKADLITTSALRIGETLEALSQRAYREVHVCGLGVYCDWAELEQACGALAKRGASLQWYCGRGYLDADRKRFESVCSPVFIDADTNTGAVAKYFQLTDADPGRFLTDLARFDHNIAPEKVSRKPTSEQERWADLVAAAISQYFKYQDEETYLGAVRKLAAMQFGTSDRRAVEFFRRTRFQYVLHGRSPHIRTLRERIKKCARVDRPLIITGESGVGKEHVAQLVFEASTRREEAFVAVNCALYAGSASLANSDLFGHLKGTFTGADKDRQGKFAAADNGFLYLDEIGELPLEIQAKLLRVFEDGWLMPEGADRPTKRVDVRVIAATNRHLPDLVRAGSFRADLYHRLSTLRLHVPPLRDRPEDIRVILEERLEALRNEGYDRVLTRNDYAVLRDYDWPGNVRQLIKLVERAFYLDMPIQDAMEEEKALGELRPTEAARPAVDDVFCPRTRNEVVALEEVKNRYARHAWELFERNYTAAARALGIQTNTLRYTCLGEKRQK